MRICSLGSRENWVSTLGYQGGIECHLSILNENILTGIRENWVSTLGYQGGIECHFILRENMLTEIPSSESLVIDTAKVIGRHHMMHNQWICWDPLICLFRSWHCRHCKHHKKTQQYPSRAMAAVTGVAALLDRSRQCFFHLNRFIISHIFLAIRKIPPIF